MHTTSGLDEGLPETIEGRAASHPRAPILIGREDAVKGVRVAPVEARLYSADPLLDIGVIADPVAAFAGRSGEDDVGDATEFLAVSLERTIDLQAAEAIVARSHGEENVLVNPRVVLELRKGSWSTRTCAARRGAPPRRSAMDPLDSSPETSEVVRTPETSPPNMKVRAASLLVITESDRAAPAR